MDGACDFGRQLEAMKSDGPERGNVDFDGQRARTVRPPPSLR